MKVFMRSIRSTFICACLLPLFTVGAQAHDHVALPITHGTPEAAFMQDNQVAMDKMMAGMAIKPAGNIDEDFLAMMASHHQGAIDMAMAELRYGTHPQLRRIAQEIIVTQQQEITAMYQALGKPLPPSQPAPDQITPVSQPVP